MTAEQVPRRVPRPPAYAWAWLQRSRPVVQALSERLTGGPPSPQFVDELRAAFPEDPFVHAVVIDTIAEVAFAGRIPRRRPAGVQWDRGLSWWAATLSGVSRQVFERSVPVSAEQVELFPTGRRRDVAADETETPPVPPERSATPRPSPVVTLERRRVANALRALLQASDGDAVPASAVRQLLHDLESDA